MQHDVLYGYSRWGLPLNETTLPNYLNLLGYKNYMVGKWHLGHFIKEHTPLFRGFDSHYGYWTGHQDYYDHTHIEGVTDIKLFTHVTNHMKIFHCKTEFMGF